MDVSSGRTPVRQPIPRPGRPFSLLLPLAACFAVASAAGCARQQAGEAPVSRAVPVKTIVLEAVSIPDSSEYLAALKSRHSAQLNPQVAGQVTKIFVRSGDQVKGGAPIMQIDPLEQQALVASQEAARAAQVSSVQYAKIQWDRAQKLYEAGVVSKQDYDQARTTYEAAQAQLRSLDAQVRQQQVQLHYYRVVAPTDGIVGDIPVRVGDRVTTSTLLTTIDERGSLELYLNIPLEREKDLKLGQTVQILNASGDVLAESRTDFISPEVDTSSQSILVKATVPNRSRALRTSQFVQARIVWGTHHGLLIPVLAVSRISGQYFAFVVEGQGKTLVARQRQIRVGPITGNQYEVLDGLKAGDHVVVEGAQELADGMPVTETPAGSGGKTSG